MEVHLQETVSTRPENSRALTTISEPTELLMEVLAIQREVVRASL